MISAPWPEIRNLLFEASSHANTSGGRTFTSFCAYSSTCRTASDLTVMLPLASTSCAPKRGRSHPPSRPVGGGADAACRTDCRPCGTSRRPRGTRPRSRRRALAAAAAGYIASTSMPAYSFMRSMRVHGPLNWLPTVAGHCDPLPLHLAKILDRGIDRAVAREHLLHHIVHRLEASHTAPVPRSRGPMMSWPGLGLRLGGASSRACLPEW